MTGPLTSIAPWPGDDPHRLDRVLLLRAAAAAGQPPVNGIVSVEVVEIPAGVELAVELVFPDAAVTVLRADVTITGGVRRPTVAVTHVTASGARLRVEVARRGDFSDYVLTIARHGLPLPGFDRLLSAITFGFRRQCEQPFDCEADAVAPAPPPATAAINYLARDYEGFRRLMLDRFTALVPGWRDPGPADPVVTLIEVLASAADRISYRQDAAATEAYLDTARRRVSARRHARLTDYRMHDGANARAFVHVELRRPTGATPPVAATVWRGCRFMTRSRGVAAASGETVEAINARAEGAAVFEAMLPARLTSGNNRLVLHDYLGGKPVLPGGSTAATLVDADRRADLRVGDFVLLEEVLDPGTGDAAPDITARHVVRLTEVLADIDPVGVRDGAGVPGPLPVLRIRWGTQDALPFDLNLARVTSGDALDGIAAGIPDQPSAVARGNIVLVDHGETQAGATLLPWRMPGRRHVSMTLDATQVTQAAPLADGASAALCLAVTTAEARPAIAVRQDLGTGGKPDWSVEVDLLASQAEDRHLVLEVEADSEVTLRSGDGIAGALPDPEPMTVWLRIGNGRAGNVGAGAIAHLLSDAYVGPDDVLVTGFGGQPGDVARVVNPLAAVGGVDPESIADVRLKAPIAFRQAERAVTPEDYATILRRHPRVQNARAIERWTGSWRVIVLIVDLVGGGGIDAATEAAFRAWLERYRLAGHALEFRNPTLAPLELAMTVCVAPDADRDRVQETLLGLFSSTMRPNGELGLFHPDRLTFGEPIRLSRLYATAQGVAGVRYVEITSLKRQGTAGAGNALNAGGLEFGAYEVPVLANDPNFPDRGFVSFTMTGGR